MSVQELIETPGVRDQDQKDLIELRSKMSPEKGKQLDDLCRDISLLEQYATTGRQTVPDRYILKVSIAKKLAALGTT
jgi:hypothetical protein